MGFRNAVFSRAGAAGAALAMTVLAAPATAGDEVVAVGRRVGDLCVFDDPVHLSGDRMVTADESCRLVGSAGEVNLSPTPTAKPKVRAAAERSGGDVPEVYLEDADDVAGMLWHERDYWVTEARAVWPFYDEDGVLAYEDRMTFRYRRSRYDGTVSHVVPGAGTCVTGATFPNRPSAGRCEWTPGIWGGKTFSFTSGGHYENHVGLVRTDARDVEMSLVSKYTDRVVTTPSCSPLGTLPVGWSTSGCDVNEDIVLW